ncbi:MAG: TPM domain-containing protein [Desulfatiglandales bacterium]
MKLKLSDHDRSRLDARIAETEKRTRTQIVLTIIQRSDTYAELPWKAFALGASVAGLLLLLMNRWLYGWYPHVTALITVVGILACGSVLALLTVMIPRFGRCFLSDHRAEVEVQQYARSLFLERELFATQRRTGILVLVSLFERRVVILPDKGLDERLREYDIQDMIAAMTPSLKRKQISQAFHAGLDQLSHILTPSAPDAGYDELSNEIIEEDGV